MHVRCPGRMLGLDGKAMQQQTIVQTVPLYFKREQRYMVPPPPPGQPLPPKQPPPKQQQPPLQKKPLSLQQSPDKPSPPQQPRGDAPVNEPPRGSRSRDSHSRVTGAVHDRIDDAEMHDAQSAVQRSRLE